MPGIDPAGSTGGMDAPGERSGTERLLVIALATDVGATLVLAVFAATLDPGAPARQLFSALVLVAAGGLVFALVTAPIAVMTHGESGADAGGRARIWAGLALNTAGSLVVLALSRTTLETVGSLAVLAGGAVVSVSYLVLLPRVHRGPAAKSTP